MAGAGYDISASRSEATSQAANQQAGTVINFGSGKAGDVYAEQAANPAATAVAARTAGNTAGGVDATLPGNAPAFHEQIDWPMVAIAFIAVASIGAAIYYHNKG
jgi:lysozyme family protein